MQPIKTSLTLIFASLLLIGCNKAPKQTFAELDQILAPTETQIEDRTTQWYKDQDLIRADILGSCYAHISETAQREGGEYERTFLENMYELYHEFPDCHNARQGEILAASDNKLSFEHQIAEIDKKMQSAQVQAEINQAAEQVARQLAQQAASNREVNEMGKAMIDKIAESP